MRKNRTGPLLKTKTTLVSVVAVVRTMMKLAGWAQRDIPHSPRDGSLGSPALMADLLGLATQSPGEGAWVVPVALSAGTEQETAEDPH